MGDTQNYVHGENFEEKTPWNRDYHGTFCRFVIEPKCEEQKSKLALLITTIVSSQHDNLNKSASPAKLKLRTMQNCQNAIW